MQHRFATFVTVLTVLFASAAPAQTQSTEAPPIESRDCEIRGLGTLHFPVPSNWRQEVSTTRQPPSVSIELLPGDPNEFQLLLSASPAGRKFRDNPNAIKDAVTLLAQQAASRAVEGSLRMYRFTADSGSGYHYTFTDSAPDTDGYKYLWEGAVLIDELVCLNYAILSNDNEALAIENSLQLIKKVSFTAATGPVDAELRVTDEQLTDLSGRYSFAIPPGWRLKLGSVSGSVRLIHEGSGAEFAVLVKDSAGDLPSEFQALGMALPMMGGKWSRISDGSLKIGGRRANEIVSTRLYADAELIVSRNLVTIYKSRAYLIECTVAKSSQAEVEQDFSKILDSFTWNKKP